MSTPQLYSLLFVTVNGALLAEESSVNVHRRTGSQPIHTVAKGYAGESPGSGMTEIDVTSAVPTADFELDPGKFMGSLTVAEMGVVGPGGKQLRLKGFIVEDTLKHSVDNPSMIDFKFRGAFVNWE